MAAFLAPFVPYILDWGYKFLKTEGRNLVAWAANGWNNWREGRKDDAGLRDVRKKYEEKRDSVKEALKNKAPKEELKEKDKEVSDAFRDFIRYRPRK